MVFLQKVRAVIALLITVRGFPGCPSGRCTSNKGHSNATWRLSAVREQLSNLLRHSSRFPLLGTSFTARWPAHPGALPKVLDVRHVADQHDAAPDSGDQDTRRVEAKGLGVLHTRRSLFIRFSRETTLRFRLPACRV
jgi:hypothetical protein